MKVFLLTLMLLFTVNSNAITADIIATEPLVSDAEIAVVGDTVLVAVITQPIYLRSDGLDLELRIKNNCKKAYPNCTILVSRDSDIFFQLQKAVNKNDVKTISKLISMQKQRLKQRAI